MSHAMVKKAFCALASVEIRIFLLKFDESEKKSFL